MPAEADKATSPSKQKKVEKVESESDASSRTTRGKGKAAGKGKASGKAENKEREKEAFSSPPLSSLIPERRAARVVAEESMKYSADVGTRCPMPGCDSKGEKMLHYHFTCSFEHLVLINIWWPLGHITGKHETHRTISACPLYHNLTADECKVSLLYLCWKSILASSACVLLYNNLLFISPQAKQQERDAVELKKAQENTTDKLNLRRMASPEFVLSLVFSRCSVVIVICCFRRLQLLSRRREGVMWSIWGQGRALSRRK